MDHLSRIFFLFVPWPSLSYCNIITTRVHNKKKQRLSVFLFPALSFLCNSRALTLGPSVYGLLRGAYAVVASKIDWFSK
ncbi:MAG: hypothetical protein JOS17DRAFT_743300 [Linnemannia elongata]|nr:MAG: hypothetical protein JOS17DRAFT_743300 [Linnemannia elongata]